MRVVGIMLAITVVCALGTGCQTTGKPEPEPVEELKAFAPDSFVSSVYRAEGDYPDLLSRESYAVWVGEPVVDLNRSKQQVLNGNMN